MTGARNTAFATLVIVAAGRGERFGHPAKVLELAGGRPLLEWSLLAAEQTMSIRDVIIVAGDHTAAPIRKLCDQREGSLPICIVAGGDRRQDSVAAGVAHSAPDREVVLIHDGARPLAAPALFDGCAQAARSEGAAIVAIPVSDTLKRVSEMEIVETVPRDALWAAQTPQGFRRDVIVSAIARTRWMDLEFTDEASLLEALAIPVRIVPGERTNIKVTHREDLEMVAALLQARHALVKGS